MVTIENPGFHHKDNVLLAGRDSRIGVLRDELRYATFGPSSEAEGIMPIVTVSRQSNSGGAQLAKNLAARLGCRALSREVLLDSARKYNITEEELERNVSRTPGLFERLTRDSNRYVVFVKAALLQAASDGDLVYFGSAGQVFLQGISHVLKVRLEAPMEQRIQRQLAATGGDEASASRLLRAADKQQEKWVRTLYDRDWRDPTLYDLVINLASVSLDTACELIAMAVQREDFNPTVASQDKLRDASLASEVAAALVADDKLHTERLDVTAAAGKVTVLGYVSSKQQSSRIKETVAQVKGVSKADVFVTLPSDGFRHGTR